MGILADRSSCMRAVGRRISVCDLIRGITTAIYIHNRGRTVLYLDKIGMPLAFSWEYVGHRMARSCRIAKIWRSASQSSDIIMIMKVTGTHLSFCGVVLGGRHECQIDFEVVIAGLLL